MDRRQALQIATGAISLVSFQANACGIGFISFTGVDAGEMYETLYNKYNIVTARAALRGQYDGPRITPHIYSTLRDVDTFADAVEKELATA